MKFGARVENSKAGHKVTMHAGESEHSIDIPPRETGFGSSASGGELLFLALATCYCNDIYREASRKNIEVESVEVEVEGDFPAAGEGSRNIIYTVKVAARANEREIHELIKLTDRVAEVHNTIRNGTSVVLTQMEAVTV
jgi:uncharacterized OsmC-like protein